MIAFAVAALAAVVALVVARRLPGSLGAPGDDADQSIALRIPCSQASAACQAASACAPLLRSVLPRGGIGTEELHPGQAGVEVAQAVGHHLVADVAR